MKTYVITSSDLGHLVCCGRKMAPVPKFWAASCWSCLSLCWLSPWDDSHKGEVFFMPVRG